MESREPPRRDSGTADEALRRLEERLSRASEAAERLFAEAASSARAGAGTRGEAARSADPEDLPADAERSQDTRRSEPPPAGWQTPLSEDERRQGELELLLQVVQSFRDLVPLELQRRLAEALRELLLAIRALIDWCLERSERRRAASSEVQDIPIL